MKFNSNIVSLAATLTALCISSAGVADARAVAPRQVDEIVDTIVDNVLPGDDPAPEGEGEGEGEQSEQDQQLSGWGLTRADDGEGDAGGSGAFSGSQDYGGVTWQRFAINPVEDKLEEYKGELSEVAIMNYNVYVAEDKSGAFDIKLVETADRNLPSDVKRRALIKNGFIDAGGDITKLKVVGDSEIIEEGVRESIMKGLDKKGIEPNEGDSDDSEADDDVEYDDQTVTFTPNGDGWSEVNDNVFIGGLTSMFGETEGMSNHRITEIVVLIREGNIFDMRTTIAGAVGS